MIRLPRLLAALLAVALLAAACSDDAPPAASEGEPTETSSPGGGGDEPTTTTGAPPDDGDASWRDGDSAYLFDQDELRTYELTLSEEDLAFLDGDPTAEEYVEGSLTLDGETVQRVGIRYKGSIGAFFSCVSDVSFGDLSDIGGEKTCRKLSMKVKVNWDGQDQTFHGVKKLQFHAMSNDPGMMHERLGYLMYREMGVAAPRVVHARLVINGEYVGVFALVEQIDGRFTRENWDEGRGNLYKEVWPVFSGEATSEEMLFAGLKTNENEDPTFDQMRAFGAAIAGADEGDRGDALRQWMDVTEVANYVAVDRTIANDDGAFHVYCGLSADGCWPHNYYWYEDPARGTMHLIPWDLDHAFANLISPANPVTPLSDPFGEISNDCRPQGFMIPQISSACDPVIAAFASFEDEIDEQTQAFLAGPFAEDKVNALLDEWSAQIRDAVAEEADLHAESVSVRRWEQQVDYLREQVAWAHDQAS